MYTLSILVYMGIIVIQFIKISLITALNFTISQI